jgi:hypothetical protein
MNSTTTNQKQMSLISFSEAIENIAEVLSNADGKNVAEVYNSICSDKVSYMEDSIFKRKEGGGSLSCDDAIENIKEVLGGVDGDWLEAVYNRICSDQVSYVGDSMFEVTYGGLEPVL